MPVLDCLYEYARMGPDVFGRTRFLASIRMLMPGGTKLSTTSAEQAYRNVARRRMEHEETDNVPRFPTKKHLCHT